MDEQISSVSATGQDGAPTMLSIYKKPASECSVSDLEQSTSFTTNVSLHDGGQPPAPKKKRSGSGHSVLTNSTTSERGMSASTFSGIDYARRSAQASTKCRTIVFIGSCGAGQAALVKNLLEKCPVEKLDRFVFGKKHGEESWQLYATELSGKKKSIKKQLRNLSGNTNHHADLVVICIPVKPDSRFDPDIVHSLHEAYGKQIWRHCIVAFTFSNITCDTNEDGARKNIVSSFQIELQTLQVEDVVVREFGEGTEDNRFEIIAVQTSNDEGSWKEKLWSEIQCNCNPGNEKNILTYLDNESNRSGYERVCPEGQRRTAEPLPSKKDKIIILIGSLILAFLGCMAGALTGAFTTYAHPIEARVAAGVGGALTGLIGAGSGGFALLYGCYMKFYPHSTDPTPTRQPRADMNNYTPLHPGFNNPQVTEPNNNSEV